MTNAIINGFRLKDLLNILDARALVSVYAGVSVDDKVIGADTVKVYELLVDKVFMSAYGNREVKGLVSFINVTNILIEEA